MYSEEDFILISALQHYVYCPRQCGLIHVDDVWNENLFTTRGAILHEKVDTDTYETRGEIKTIRGLRIHSFKYGLVGRCDVVEFRSKKSSGHSELGSESNVENLKQNLFNSSPDQRNTLEIFPVEFKSGEPKDDVSDKVQLCAQVICLEEMLNTIIRRGAFFYAKIRRRNIIEIDNELRTQTESIIASVREIVSTKKIPLAAYSTKCKNCSLYDICKPKALNTHKLNNYIKGLYSQ